MLMTKGAKRRFIVRNDLFIRSITLNPAIPSVYIIKMAVVSTVEAAVKFPLSKRTFTMGPPRTIRMTLTGNTMISVFEVMFQTYSMY